MIKNIRKRNGDIEPFMHEKITAAIFKAARACGGNDYARAEYLTKQVVELLNKKFKTQTVYIEDVQDTVEKVLIENGHAQTAKAYILYRDKRKTSRELSALTGATIKMFNDYIGLSDWVIKENANQSRSVNGLNNYVREEFTKQYWKNEVYTEDIRKAHESGDMHIHDLGFFGPYCAGWDLKLLLLEGLPGIGSAPRCKPPKHFNSLLNMIMNSTFLTQGECAGAQAWSSFDTYLAPFVLYDNLSYKQVKQALQNFLFNMNMKLRVGFQCPFSNVTFDVKVPELLKDEPAIIGGEYVDIKYGDCQHEMDMINRAFCEVMMEGDADGRVLTFPIPTLNITKDFDWDNPVIEKWMEITCKYGIPYFANFVNSDLSPEDAVSMCCRLRLDKKELRKRGGGLFASNPLTGSIGVVTINLPRIGFCAEDIEDFYNILQQKLELARTSLEIKRKVIEGMTDNGLYPFSAYFLKDIKVRTGKYWSNHFSTIGIVGMNECLLNLIGESITTPQGQKLAKNILLYLREKISMFQDETGNAYNLEATPAEGTSYRLAKLDRNMFRNICTAGTPEAPYYTNSSHLPVNYTNDLFMALDLQDELQCLYTGGTVLHLYLGEKMEDTRTCMDLIKRVFDNYRLPYISITPTFSICSTHGYQAGEHYTCPECNGPTEVWSRVTGYLRPIDNYNKGKRQEFAERKNYVVRGVS